MFTPEWWSQTLLSSFVGLALGGLLTRARYERAMRKLRQAPVLQRLARRSHVTAAYKKPEKHRGLIFLVSPTGDAPCRKAIDFHSGTLTHLWLLYTDRSAGVAEDLRKYAQDLGVTVADFERLRVHDYQDLREVRGKVDWIHENLSPYGLESRDVIADFLGMSSNASVGMVLACLDQDRPLQYTMPRHNAEGGKMGVDDPMQVELTWTDVLNAH